MSWHFLGNFAPYSRSRMLIPADPGMPGCSAGNQSNNYYSTLGYKGVARLYWEEATTICVCSSRAPHSPFFFITQLVEASTESLGFRFPGIEHKAKISLLISKAGMSRRSRRDEKPERKRSGPRHQESTGEIKATPILQLVNLAFAIWKKPISKVHCVFLWISPPSLYFFRA